LPEKKNRILYVKRYLEEQADETHPATVADILAYLTDMGITANRRTIMLDIEQLMEAGIDVVCNKSRQNQYFIGDILFEIPELKLLVDAAQASKFLTAKRSRALIDKLLSLTSTHQAEVLRDSLYTDRHTKPVNEIAYITTDILLTAINTKRRVQFMYIEYSPDKQKTYKHNRRIYELSPWHFAWDNDKYYVIGHSESHGKPAKFRVDRIAAPKLTNIEALPTPDEFDLASFLRAVFQMYDGTLLDVTLRCENAMMNTIIDRFGYDVNTVKSGAGHFNATVSVLASKTFYGWVFGMDGSIEIVAPTEAVSAYSDMLSRRMTFVAKKS